MESRRTPLQGLVLLLLLAVAALPLLSFAYDTDVAHILVDYSASAYFCRTPACSTWACSSCQKHPNAQVVRMHDDGHNGNGLVAIDPDLDVIVVSFAGTDSHSIPNWIDDMDAVLIQYPDPNCSGCTIHLGFWQTYMAIRDQFMSAFDAARSKAPDARVWVTGHSLGGALAVHACLDLLNRTMEVDHFINFGQPRVGNAQFSSFVADVFAASGVQHYRVTHDHDPVPHLPPLAFGFHHQPKEVFYPSDEEGGFSVCDDSGEDMACSDQFHVYGSIYDHMVYLGTDFGKAEEAGLAITAELMANGTVLVDDEAGDDPRSAVSLRGAVLAVQ